MEKPKGEANEQDGIRTDRDGTTWIQLTSDPVENGRRLWRSLVERKLTAVSKQRGTNQETNSQGEDH